MNVEIYTNQYGHKKAKCPFCDQETYYRSGSQNPDKLMWIKRHIINSAKNEALDQILGDKNLKQHLDYVIKHTKLTTPVVIKSKYKFDGDIL